MSKFQLCLLIGGPWDGHKKVMDIHRKEEHLMDPPIKMRVADLIGGDSDRLVNEASPIRRSLYKQEAIHFEGEEDLIFYVHEHIPVRLAMCMLLVRYGNNPRGTDT